MTGIEHKPCYGTMFPDPLHAANDRTYAGKAFSFVVITPGGCPGRYAVLRSIEKSGTTARSARSSSDATNSAWRNSPWKPQSPRFEREHPRR